MGIYRHEPYQGKFHVITGSNGTGKSRYLGVLAKASDNSRRFDRVICLSGTLYEKFPSPREMKDKNPGYLYFGNRVNSNLVSEIAPFRSLAPMILGSGCNSSAGELAGKAFEGIGFKPTLKMKFRMGRNAKSSESRAAKELDLRLDLNILLSQTNETEYRLGLLYDKKIHLSDLELQKNGERLSLGGLSSGERLYILSILTLCFCTTDNTLVLFDEPENSLHPQWQTRLIKDIALIIESLSSTCTVVIATHSPLVVSSVPNRDSFIRDLPSDQGWIRSEHYGKNADTILVEQFGIKSPRSLSVALLIQNCLTGLLDLHSEPDRFIQAVTELESTDIYFSQDDPLYEAVQQIFEIRRSMQ